MQNENGPALSAMKGPQRALGLWNLLIRKESRVKAEFVKIEKKKFLKPWPAWWRFPKQNCLVLCKM